MQVVLRNSPIIILAGFVKAHLLKIAARWYGKGHKGKSVASNKRNNRELGGRKKLGIENGNEEKWRETEQSNFLTLSFYIG